MSETETTSKTEPKQETFLEGAWDFLKTLVISMIIVFGITNFIARPIQVVGTSMFPTLQPDSIGMANILGRRTEGLKRFDIAIIYIRDKNEYIVKRVIGLPGETVSYQSGQLYINGEPFDEPFLEEEYVSTYGDSFMEDVEPVTLAENEYYCLGDNRPHSSDSRYYGPFKKDEIECRGVFIIYPFSNFGAKTW